MYGSLKSQCGNNILLEQVEAKCLGRDSITGEFQMMSFGGFPGVVRTNDLSRPGVEPRLTTIYGETYMMDEEGLAALDMLESHPAFYERIKYRTDVLDVRAWMYTLPSGAGYLDASRYDQLAQAIWRPTEDELAFWFENDEEFGGSGEAESNDAA